MSGFTPYQPPGCRHWVVEPNTTWCPDTPENREHFERLKEALNNPIRKRPQRVRFRHGRPVIVYGYNSCKS